MGYVHIADLAALYELLLRKILDGAEIPSGRKGYYFSNTGAYTWKSVNEKIGEIGVRLGALMSASAASITLEEAAESGTSETATVFYSRSTLLEGRSPPLFRRT